MLIILDHCTSARVATTLRRANHRCHRAGELGLALADDDDLAVYADDRHAIFITHDAESVRRRLNNTFGRTIWLACKQWEAHEILHKHLEAAIELVTSREAVVVKVGRDGVKAFESKWL